MFMIGPQNTSMSSPSSCKNVKYHRSKRQM